jgi:hypothetical protein
MTQMDRERVEEQITNAKRFVWVRFHKEGIHKYPQALTDPSLEDVQYLGYPHRHMFHFEISIQVFHNDREIEFIQFKHFVENLYGSGTLDLNNRSCEMIADDLYIAIAGRYPNREVTIKVSEDGENGCTIKYKEIL